MNSFSLTAEEIISTSSGIVAGFKMDKVMNWHDIPYAKPPVGELRWKAPQLILESNKKIIAKEGNFCVQEPYERGGAPGDEDVSGSEDCLYLDIQAPLSNSESKLPVMFWIHGGGNTSGLKDSYNFSKLVQKEKVIVVSINYRLGALGWFTHPSIQSLQSGLDKSSNFGTLDIIAALKWTQENIEKFGGDPNNVTIFGESAGGHNVLSLLVSKEAKGLFHKAISQSGYTTTYSIEEAYKPKESSNTSDASSSEIFSRLLKSIDYPKLETEIEIAEQRKILKEINAYELFLLYQDDAVNSIPLITEDGITMPFEGMKSALSNPKHINIVPTIAGSNRDEVKLWLASAEYFVKLEESFLGNMINIPKPVLKDKKAYAAFNYFRATAWQLRGVDQPLSSLYQAGNKDVFAYRFDWDDHRRYLFTDFAELIGAFHASEIPLISGNDDIVGEFDFILYPKGPSKRFTEKNMMSFWAYFAKKGYPGKSTNNKEWTPYIDENRNKSIMILDKRSNLGITGFNKDLDSLVTELELSSVINSREQCALLFQITTFVGEDVFDEYQDRLNGKCTKNLAKAFLDENSGVIDF
ncbi:carboxylesterase family protein [Gammaproteobacteria bacterium]|nr:carboxylesterase family protein [Gammaproteobacteria bacterium]